MATIKLSNGLEVEALVTVGCDENGLGGVALPEPAIDGYEANTSTLVDSGRNVQGVMVGAVIREDIAKVSEKWNFLTVEQWATINKLFNTAEGGSFINNVKFFNQSTGKHEVRQMYVSDRKAGVYLRDSQSGNIIGWKNCSLSLIEV